MKESHKKAMIIILALLLVISFRLPITPHELGQDSYTIKYKIDSIIEEGYAKWVVHPLAIFGLYNYSYPSGSIYLLAILAPVINISTELTIFILSLIFAIIGFTIVWYMKN